MGQKSLEAAVTALPSMAEVILGSVGEGAVLAGGMRELGHTIAFVSSASGRNKDRHCGLFYAF